MNVVDKQMDQKNNNTSVLDILSEMIDGDSPETKSMKKLIAMVSQTDSTALVLGETGTGKDVVAQAIHKCSKKKGALVTVNCAAIPSELLESELFGHEKGSFTGADKQRKGRFEQSSGGSLFLDEIGDMPLPLQAKLLRAIESRTIQRVGGAEDIKIDLRLICATHRDLEKKVESGEFRADLYFRINVLPINVPSLAERRTDIPDLYNKLLKNLNLSREMQPIFSPEAITALSKHNWPGNVRELKNVIERACIIFPGKEVTSSNVFENLLRLKVPTLAEEQNAIWEMTADLSGINHIDSDDKLDSPEDYLPHPKNYKNWFTFYDEIDLRRHLQDVEIVLIEQALEKTGNKIAHAADKLKLRRTTLIEKMKQRLLLINPPVDVSQTKISAAFIAHRHQFYRSPVYSFAHIFINPERETELESVIKTIQDQRLNATTARYLSSPFMSGYEFQAQTTEQLARSFGTLFVSDLTKADPIVGQWHGPIRSSFGWHYVWVSAIEPGRDARLEEVAGQLRRSLEVTAREQALQIAIADLRADYEVRQ